MMAIKEIEYRGSTSSGPLPDRIASLTQFMLEQLETRYELASSDTSIPERIKSLRQKIVQEIEQLDEESTRRGQLRHDLDDIFFAVQMFSYPGDYVSQSPNIERLAETLDKLEEDILEVRAPVGRAARRGVVALGEPIEVQADKSRKQAAANLTRTLEERVQALLDSITPPDRAFGNSDQSSLSLSSSSAPDGH